MTKETLVPEGTLTLPFGVLRTLHNGASEVRLYRDIVADVRRVGKRVSLLGREDTLLNEAAFLSANSHPNVAEMYVVAEPTGTDPLLDVVEIMMPYYEAGSVLDAMVKDGRRFRVSEARDFAVKALRGLAYLHGEQRVLHRDFKPANLFLTSDRNLVKIGDFGEAMRMASDDACPPLLSPQFWTPPETFEGHRYGVSSEIFSVGLSLHEMLNGPFPYDDYTVESLSKRLAAGRCAVLPRHLNPAPHVPRSLRRVVSKATQNKPSSRYQSAHQMLEALKKATFVDWGWPEFDGASALWTGEFEGAELRLGVRRIRGGSWRAWVQRRYETGWRQLRGCPSIDAASFLDAAEAMFAHVERQLTRV